MRLPLAVLLVALRIVVIPAYLGAQSAPSSTPVPSLIAYQGQLLASNGEPRTGNVLLTFALYADQTGGAPLWTEQHVVALDAAGYYAIILGARTQGGLPRDFFITGTARWIGVAVDADPEQPRFMLLSVAYALKASDADTVGGKTPGEFVLATNFTEKVTQAVKESRTSGSTIGIQSVTLNMVQKGDGIGGMTDSNIFENGNVGIGETSPATLAFGSAKTMHLKDTVNGSVFRLQGTASNLEFGSGSNSWMWVSTNTSLGFATNNLERMRVTNTGNVGVGVSNPDTLAFGSARTLHLKDAVNGGVFRLEGSASNLEFGSGVNSWLWVTTNTSLGFATNNLERMRVTPAGDVGIGTSTPTAKLQVAGDATVTGNFIAGGNIAAKYQDVAEWVEVSAPIEAGTVVIVDPSMPNRVVPAPKAYDSRVAGAVSRQPGLVLGEKSESRVMVAQSGRVRIKADARYGAIKIGDLLVTSPTQGYAMKSRPMKVGGQTMHRPGTLLGKALEALPSGKGEILVLLTLQ